MKIKFGMVFLASALAAASASATVVATTNTFTGSSSISGWYNMGSVNATIAYSSGAGPRWDYWDGDDAVEQPAAESSEAAAIVAAGGTITGDGLLADGALWFDVQDGETGNEYIAFNLGGTMDEGETITFSYSVFNNNDYYNYTQGQLWDVTTGTLLAVAGATPQNANGWTIVKARSGVDYQPYDWSVSYTATAAEAGHELAIVFREWANSNQRDPYIDNIAVTSSTPKAIEATINTFADAGSVNGWYNIGTVNAVISHSNGAGPRWDYWDGDDLVSQPAAETSEAAAIIAADGTITGDEALADGALWFDVQDGVSGNESIALTLPGEMVEGEMIRFSYNAFNNNDYWNMVQGQLWDMTVSNQLAVANWVTVSANSAVDYRPYNAAVSYLTTAAEAGHKLAIVFREWGNSNQRDPYIDNIRVTTTLIDPEAMYQRWASDNGLTSLNHAYTADPDGDELNNLGEYGIGGDPTDGANRGIRSTGGISDDNGTNWLSYVHPRRSDFWLGGLDYHLETRTNLVDGADWADGNYSLFGIGETGDALDYVTNRFPPLGTPAQFVRLAITEPAIRPPASEELSAFEQKTVLFSGGDDGIDTYRIPALITAANGDLVACVDGRHYSGADLKDSMDIDIVFKRSTDHGVSWSSMNKVCDFGYGYPASDASLILDRTTGEIFCFYNYMDQNNAPGEYRFYLQRSTDCGATWGSSLDFTDQISEPSWTNDFKFMTSGRGIQLQNGRLLHNLVKSGEVYLFGSDDHGASWQRIDVPVRPANESKVVELTDGSLMVNSRVSYEADARWVHVSDDEGQSWTSLPDPNLADPGCNASIIRYTSKKDGYAKDRLLFCNASNADVRTDLAVRISYDEGKSWSAGKIIDTGDLNGYSSLTICEDGSIAVLYEGDNTIIFARFTLEALTDGKDTLSIPYQL